MSSSLSGFLHVLGCNFGAGCRFQCNCENGTDCDPITGECTAGYSCREAKPNSTYGWGGPGCLTGLLCSRIVVRITAIICSFYIQDNCSDANPANAYGWVVYWHGGGVATNLQLLNVIGQLRYFRILPLVIKSEIIYRESNNTIILDLLVTLKEYVTLT